MPQFSFKLTTGERVVAAEYKELRSIEQARANAISSARRLAERYPKRAWEKWNVLVLDHRDTLVFALPLEMFGGFAEQPSPASAGGTGALAEVGVS